MDDKGCVRSTFAYMPRGITSNTYADNNQTSLKKGKPRLTHERKCRGDIVYVQNPLFKNVALHSKGNLSNGCKFPLNYNEQNNNNNKNNNSENNYFHRFFAPIQNLQNSIIPNKVNNNNKKNRKDGMKARAETRRRDIISNESSDEDYSSINSSVDLKSSKNSIRISSNMDDAHSRKSRAARTERYFRRLSREENSQDYDSSGINCRVNGAGRVQEARLSLGKCDTLPFSNPGRNSLGERSRNLLLIDRNDEFLSNPIYRSSRADSPLFYKKHCAKDTTEKKNYGNTRRSDPGGGAILAYKNKTPRTLDRVQYIEPNIFNFQQPEEIFKQNKPASTPKRVVRRSYSFQSEIPRDYEARNSSNLGIFSRNQIPQGSKSTNNDYRELDSLLSSTMANLQDRKVFSPIDRGDMKTRKKNSTPETDNSGSLNILSNLSGDKSPAKKKSPKDFGKELSELEKMYTSLRLSDDNLLDRAEERCVEEFCLKNSAKDLETLKLRLSSGSSTDSIPGESASPKEKLKSSEAHVINDDMAYRKMQTKKMPALSETQNSLSQISYLLASSALILGDAETQKFDNKKPKEEPNITKDDMVYRNLSYANNVLRVVEPQPPFGIPLRPATPSTNSNYLCSSPVTVKSPPLKYVPQSEPNLVTDDLAFRNLRKDAPKSPSVIGFEETEKNVDDFGIKNEFEKSINEDNFFRKKKKAVRSLSANLYGLINEVHNLQLNFE